MKKLLLLNCMSNSDFDLTNIFVMEINQENMGVLNRLRRDLDLVKKVKSFNTLSVFESLGQFKYDDDYLLNEDEYMLTDSNQFNLDSLTESESPKDTFMVDVRFDGVVFECYGKHTGELFYTEKLSWSVIDEMNKSIGVDIKNDPNLDGRYMSTNDFVNQNKLEKEAVECFGENWEAEDDIEQIKQIIDHIGHKNTYIVYHIVGLKIDEDIQVINILDF